MILVSQMKGLDGLQMNENYEKNLQDDLHEYVFSTKAIQI